jgi:CubicO group peptidase (beta-lactamase class C family)
MAFPPAPPALLARSRPYVADDGGFGARSFLALAGMAAADAVLADRGTDSAALAQRMATVIDERLAAGRQTALVICAYYKGVEIVHVGGGRVRRADRESPWRPVQPSDLFAVFSVSKGITAAALATLVSDGQVSYETSASAIWADLDQQAGTVRDVASHRAGVPVLAWCVAALAIPLLCGLRVWPLVWDAMCRLVARATRRPRPGGRQHATYHQISFSFLIGALIERAAKCTVGAAVHAGVAKPLLLAPSHSESSFFLGEVPHSADARIVRIERPPCGGGALCRAQEALCSGPPECSWMRWVLLSIVAPVEALFICGLCNLGRWRRLLLPSSNGFFTAAAVARIFGALANGGEVRVGERGGGAEGGEDEDEDGSGGSGGSGGHKGGGVWVRLASKAVVDEIARRVADPRGDVASTHPDHGEMPASAPNAARESSGWFPWASQELHGARAARRVLNSEGMGGTAAWADPAEGLAVCILKAAYEPLSALGGSISPDVVVAAAELRIALGLEEEGDRGAAARYPAVTSRARS